MIEKWLIKARYKDFYGKTQWSEIAYDICCAILIGTIAYGAILWLR